MENMPSTAQAMKDYIRYAKAQIVRNNKHTEKLKMDIEDIKMKLNVIFIDDSE